MRKRTITLLGSGVQTSVDFGQWPQAGGVKEFDKDSTKILRVFRNQEQFIVYGMNAKAGKIVREGYEMAPGAASVSQMLELVAKHCGISDLAKKVTLQ